MRASPRCRMPGRWGTRPRIRRATAPPRPPRSGRTSRNPVARAPRKSERGLLPRSGNSILEFVNLGEEMPKAIRIQQQGGPEVLKWEDVQAGDPGPGEARVGHNACGLNFLNVYQRSGLYKIALPSGMGNEAAGVVEAVGAGVTQVKTGDRVAYAGGAPG